MSQVEARESDGVEPAAPPKGNPLRRFQDKLRGSLGRDGKEQKHEAHPDGHRGGGGDDADTAAADGRQGGLSPRAHPGVARISVPEVKAAGPAHAHPGGHAARQEPKAKGQVVGRMGVGVSGRGAGGMDAAQPAKPAMRAADADDYGVHPACAVAPGPASPKHKRSSSGHSHGVVSRALQAVKSKVARGDGKHRAEAGHVDETHPGGGKQHEEPAMHTAFAAAPGDGGGNGGGIPGSYHDVSSSGEADGGLPAAAHAPDSEVEDLGLPPAQWQATRADAEAEVAAATAAVRTAGKERVADAAAAGSTSDPGAA